MVLAHEMGHSFGLSHDPDVVSTVIISVITDYFGLFGLLLLFGVRARLCQRAVLFAEGCHCTVEGVIQLFNAMVMIGLRRRHVRDGHACQRAVIQVALIAPTLDPIAQ